MAIMQKLLAIYFIVFLFFTKVSAQIPLGVDKCADFCPAINSSDSGGLEDVRESAGIKYFYASVPFPWQRDYTCTYSNFTVLSNATALIQEVSIINGQLQTIDIHLALTNTGETLTMGDLNLPLKQRAIYADNNVVVILSCFECGLYSSQGAGYYVTVLTRLQFPSCDQVQPAFDAMDQCGIPRSLVIKQRHTNCDICFI